MRIKRTVVTLHSSISLHFLAYYHTNTHTSKCQCQARLIWLYWIDCRFVEQKLYIYLKIIIIYFISKVAGGFT